MNGYRGIVAVLLLTLAAGAAEAVVAPTSTSVPAAEVPLPTDFVEQPVDLDVQRNMSRESTALARLNDDHGEWQVALWNTLTGVPERAFGEPIALVAPGATESEVVAAARAFVDEYADLFGTENAELAFLDARLRRDTYYVFFQQTLGGVPVRDATLFLRVGVDGRLVAFGSQVYPDAALSTWPSLSQSAAETAATSGLSTGSDDVTTFNRRVVVPVPWENEVSYIQTYEFDVSLGNGDAYTTFVDASNGQVLWRYSRHTHIDIEGNISGLVVAEDPNGPQFEGVFREMRVRNEDNTVELDWTDENGDFLIPHGGVDPQNLRARLAASNNQFIVNNQAGVDGEINVLATPGVFQDLLFDDSNSLLEERVPYHHLQVQKDDLEILDPGYPFGLSFVQVLTNYPGNCNAQWTGTTVRLYAAGGACISMGRIPTAATHEYGHGLSHWIYEPNSLPCSMIEGHPDNRAMFHTRQPQIGTAWQGPGSNIRTGENTLTWPNALASCPCCGYSTGECHCKGQVTMGAVWKMRENFVNKYGETVGDDLAERAMSYALYARAATPQDYLIDILTEDDDDGNLNNGTPNWNQICDAFDFHGLPCPAITESVSIFHVPLTDTTDDTNPYTVTAEINAIGDTIDPSQIFLNYRVNGGSWNMVLMGSIGANNYEADIPAQGGGNVVEYYISAEATGGAFATDPSEAPFFGVHTFGVGLFSTSFFDQFETDEGWTSGAAGDDATGGQWVLDDPLGTTAAGQPANPDNDATPAPGVECYFTGQGTNPASPAEADVDNGCTSLVSPQFSLVGANMGRLTFQRWFYDSSSLDEMTVYISNDDGGSWTEVASFTGFNSWVTTDVNLLNHEVPFTMQMRAKFVACDLTPQSVVEAAVDDFQAKVLGDVVDVDASTVPTGAFRVAQNAPNPFNPTTRIQYEVPANDHVTIRVYGVAGQLVRTLMDAPVRAGVYSVQWDGTNDAGVPVATGSYYYKVTAGANETVRRMTLLK